MVRNIKQAPVNPRPPARVRRHLVPFLLVGGLAALATAAQDPLEYRNRGDRHEGVRSKPVTGHDLELLGAMVELPESVSPRLPESLVVRFFLDRREEVYLTVRERDPLEHYWLDKVRPAGWRAGTNVFTWPSREVVEPLGLRASELVVLARLGRSTPGARERVAPVIFDPAAAPERISAYRFTFKANGSAKIRHRLYGPASTETPVARGPERRRAAGVAFDVRWEAGSRPQGHYRLLLEGYFLNDNERIVLEVGFFHAPAWPR